MDINKLFEDFKNHVEQLDNDMIKQSISRAVEHSINSSYLDKGEYKSMTDNDYIPIPDVDYPAVEDYYDSFPIDEYTMMQAVEVNW